MGVIGPRFTAYSPWVVRLEDAGEARKQMHSSIVSRQSPIPPALLFLLLCGASAAAQEPIAIASRYPVVSRVLGETRQVAVRMPAGNAAGRRHPVLYLPPDSLV